MEHEDGWSRGVALVDVMHAEPIDLDVMGMIRIVLEIDEAGVRRLDSPHVGLLGS
jgi:hypothetical protein